LGQGGKIIVLKVKGGILPGSRVERGKIDSNEVM
jgi:hypothetical protein